MPEKWSTIAQVRAPRLVNGQQAVDLQKKMTVGQPLLLSRDPDNAVDPSAVFVSDLFGVKIGYVQRPHATEVARWMDSGFTLLAAVHTPLRRHPVRPVFRSLFARIWLDEGPGETVAVGVGSLDTARTPELVD